MACKFFGVDNHVCLLGPPQSGKSSLLFQHAVSCADNGGCCVFITPRPLATLPLLSKSSQLPLSHNILSQIHFKYPSTLSALQELFDNAHLPNGLVSHKPDCVIIDNFHHYFTHLNVHGSGQDVTLAMVKICAHIIDGLAYVTSQQPSSIDPCTPGGQPVCVLSLTPQQHLNTDIMRRWFPNVLNINVTAHNTVCLERGKEQLLCFKFQENCFEIINCSNEN